MLAYSQHANNKFSQKGPQIFQKEESFQFEKEG